MCVFERRAKLLKLMRARRRKGTKENRPLCRDGGREGESQGVKDGEGTVRGVCHKVVLVGAAHGYVRVRGARHFCPLVRCPWLVVG